ncbi:tail fiber domain-containing protein [Chryseobacterium sp. NRRL B-14859]|uniref:tail fiber domain-containing protein n=1 Tax=Chryseobacterium sp. NRRL B-14859 TaxID=1562763 RepID=UPI00339B2062
MKTIKTFVSLLLLSGAGLSVSAQNVWTGTTIPTTTAGNVGIATATPASRLDISSNSAVSALKITHGYKALLGGNVPNITEIYTYPTNLLPAPSPSLINWLTYGGVFGLRSLSNTASEDRMMYNDKDGNLKSSNLTVYSSPTFGNGTLINSIRGVAYLSFLNGGSGSGCGFCTVSGGSYGIYIDRLGVGKDASSTFDLDVSGAVRGQSFVTTSDQRLKDNIRLLEDKSSHLLNISSYSYTFKNKKQDRNAIRNTDTEKLHFGFMAQEVEKEFPNLVSKDEEGNYALNYIEFIPLLLNELKDQKKEINELKTKMEAMEARMNAISEGRSPQVTKEKVSASFSLEQNVPNPFNQETVIKFNAEGTNVMIGIFDLSGRQLQTIPVKKGERQISVSARTFTPGTYIYNLMSDGKIVDSKKMIVTN